MKRNPRGHSRIWVPLVAHERQERGQKARGTAGRFSEVDQDHLVPFFEKKLKYATPESRDVRVQSSDELGKE